MFAVSHEPQESLGCRGMQYFSSGAIATKLQLKDGTTAETFETDGVENTVLSTVRVRV